MNRIPETRQVVAVHGDGHLRLIEEPIPAVEPGMVLIKVNASLVSPGSELGGGWQALRHLQLNPEEREPRKIGYSNAGTVLASGDNVTRFSKGQRVCGVGGGFALHADYAVVPQNLVIAIPDGVSDAEASYAMLLATGLQALRRGNPAFGEYVAVAAMGIVGLLTARIFQLAGCEVIGWDLNQARLEKARELGIQNTVRVGSEDVVARTLAFTEGAGLDHGVIALGGNSEKPYDSLMECMKVTPDGHAMGNIIIVGGAIFPYKKNLSNVNLIRSSRTGPGYHDSAWELGADYPPVHVRWNTRNNLELCLRLLAQGKINVDLLTTHTIPFSQVESLAAEATSDPDSILGLVFDMKA